MPITHGTPSTIAHLEPSPADARELLAVVKGAMNSHKAPDAPEFLEAAPLLAADLPASIRKFLAGRGSPHDTSCAFILSLPSAIPTSLPATPSTWSAATELPPDATGGSAFALVLLSFLLGEPFAWLTQQDANLLHTVVPIKGHEKEQLGSGSLVPLSWHTEDAFHPYRADYIALVCLRNPDQVATTVASVQDLPIDAHLWQVLSRPYFEILPDFSHRPAFNTDSASDGEAFNYIDALLKKPQRTPILFGDEASPYLRIDKDFSRTAPDAPLDATEALAAISQAIEVAQQDVVLQPGDFLFLDNYLCVHGRRPFTARYDGTDRWLQRINISRDLRPARIAGACSRENVMT